MPPVISAIPWRFRTISCKGDPMPGPHSPRPRHRRFRKWLWLTACAIPALLWCRSYTASDSVMYWWGPLRGYQQSLHLHSGHGGIGFYSSEGRLLDAEPGGRHLWWRSGPRDADTLASVVLENFIPQWV